MSSWPVAISLWALAALLFAAGYFVRELAREGRMDMEIKRRMAQEEALPIEGTRLLLEFQDAAGRVWRGAAVATPVETVGGPPARLEDLQGLQMRLLGFKVVTR